MQKRFSFSNLSKYRNALMGLQILLIVFFHYTEDCMNSEIHCYRLIRYYFHYIRSSGVDIFLLLSGMGLYFSWKKNPNFHAFIKKRLGRVLVPYCAVAIPGWLWRDVFFEGTGSIQFFKDVTFLSFFTDGQRWFWYILMILVCYLIFPFLYSLVEDTKNYKCAILRIALLCLFTTVISVVLKVYFPEQFEKFSIALVRFPAFFVGCLMGKAVYEKREIPVWGVYAGLLSAGILAVGFRLVYVIIIQVYVQAFLNFALCLFVIMAAERIFVRGEGVLVQITNKVKQILEWLGGYSLELYLLHVFVRRVMNKMGYPTYLVKYEVIMIVISIFLSILLGKMTESVKRK